MVNFMLWVGFLWFLLVWVVSIAAASRYAYHRKVTFKYGLVDVIGVICFIGLLIRYWE